MTRRPHRRSPCACADSVEDVSFCKSLGGGGDVFASVGDDLLLLVWDARARATPVLKVRRLPRVACVDCCPSSFTSPPYRWPMHRQIADAHREDLHCVDWNPLSANYVLTGSQDASVCLHDIRVSSGSASSVCAATGAVSSPSSSLEMHLLAACGVVVFVRRRPLCAHSVDTATR